MSLRDAVESATRALEAAGVESAQVDAELLLAFTLGISRGELQIKLVMNEEAPDLTAFQTLLARRIEREPLQHLTGVAHFRNLTLKVGKGVFIPRPETEQLAQYAIDAAKSYATESPIVVDLCAGSGAVGIAVATELPNSRVYAVELSSDAIEFTRENYATYSPDSVVIHGDAADGVPELNGQVSVVVTNPPYIPTGMVPIYPEVHLHDPEIALYSGEDGLELIRKLSKVAAELLHEGGTLAIEHADSQSEAISQLLLADGWRNVVDHQDFNGRPRAVTAIK
ncbi:MAG: hypothetical protein RLZ71_935 [Actinomycetota bacterium]|jgi:release factor glutamine methyltransferase